MAVQRFLLDTSQLDDIAYGLDGPSGRSFILDTSELDGADVLNGSPFLTTANGATTLGGLVATASADVQVTVLGSGSAELGGLVASATTKTKKSAIAVANLHGLIASATTKTSKFAIGSANLGGLVATATASDAPAPPTPEPTPSGGRQYAAPRRKKIEPLPIVEIPIVQPKRYRSAIASTMLGGMTCTATSSITFSILDDDAEVLLLV